MLDMNERDEYVAIQQNAPVWFFLLIWLGWVVVTIIGYLAGQWLADAAMNILAGNAAPRLLTIEGNMRAAGITGYVAAAVGGALAGVALGIAQGLLLLPFLKREGVGQWLIATIAGRTVQWVIIYSMGLAISGLVFDKSPLGVPLLFLVLGVAAGLGGVALGYPQSQVFRTRSRRYRWWIATSILAPVITSVVIAMTLFIEAQNTLRDYTTLLTAVLAGVATGSALLEQLHHPRKEAEWRDTLTWERDEDDHPISETVLGSSLYSPRPGPGSPTPPDAPKSPRTP